jgi:nucleoid-associated protein YgaU
MSRYGSSKISRSGYGNTHSRNNRKSKSLAYRTTVYDDVPERDDDIHVITQPGDRLDNLALTFYGSPIHWWFIAHVNNLTTMNIEVGSTLRIPSTLDNANGR